MINIMKYLKEFIIGSSAIITIPWFISVNYSIKMNHANYPYYNFTMYSPIRLGLWNVGSAIIADYFGISQEIRFLLVTFFHWIATIVSVYYYDLYTFIDNKKMMNKYFIQLLIAYFVHWNFIVYNLEKYI